MFWQTTDKPTGCGHPRRFDSRLKIITKVKVLVIIRLSKIFRRGIEAFHEFQHTVNCIMDIQKCRK